MTRRTNARAPKGVAIDLTINLNSGDEVDIEGTAESLADVGRSVEEMIAKESKTFSSLERWTSLVIVVVQ